MVSNSGQVKIKNLIGAIRVRLVRVKLIGMVGGRGRGRGSRGAWLGSWGVGWGWGGRC